MEMMEEARSPPSGSRSAAIGQLLGKATVRKSGEQKILVAARSLALPMAILVRPVAKRACEQVPASGA